VGSAKEEFLAFRRRQRRDAECPGTAAIRLKAPESEALDREGSGCIRGGRRLCRRHRAVFAVRFEDVVNVLHAYQPKSAQGRRDRLDEPDLVSTRLKNRERNARSSSSARAELARTRCKYLLIERWPRTPSLLGTRSSSDKILVRDRSALAFPPDMGAHVCWPKRRACLSPRSWVLRLITSRN
jgi:hypothetical protein